MIDEQRIRGAWEGRISGCMLGKPVEVLSMMEGADALDTYLADAGATPLRDYVPHIEGTLADPATRVDSPVPAAGSRAG